MLEIGPNLTATVAVAAYVVMMAMFFWTAGRKL